MPGFVVYLCLYKNLAFVSNPLMKLNFLEIERARISRIPQLIPQGVRDILR